MSNAVVIESLDPPVMDIAGCIKCEATSGNNITMEWRITVTGKSTAVLLHFCTTCGVEYLACDTDQTKEIERHIAALLGRITAELDAAAIAGPPAGGIQ